MEKYRLLKQEECKVNSSFWNSYVKLIKEKVIPYQWEILNDRVPDSEPSHAIDNFRIAAHQWKDIFRSGFPGQRCVQMAGGSWQRSALGEGRGAGSKSRQCD